MLNSLARKLFNRTINHLKRFLIMKRKRMPNSMRKHVRLEKARIRRQVLNVKEQDRLIDELYKKLAPKKNENK